VALVPCLDCGNQISSEAWACPKCGRPLKGNQLGKRFAIIFVLMIVVITAVTALMNTRRH
jgi:predicted nucleic acid-binding Zn ribbon protein